MRRWIIVRWFALVLAALFVADPAAPQAQARDRDRDQESRRGDRDRDDESRRVDPAPLSLPVTGKAVGTGETFTGMLSVQRFARRGSEVIAVGVITGTVANNPALLIVPVEVPVKVTTSKGTTFGLDPSGAPARPFASQSAAPRGFILVQAPTPATCGVLHLELGAINLNFLGLVIMTNPILVDISGQTGGLLGTLVCQVLGLASNLINTLVGLLNQILGVLGGLTGGLLPGLPI